MTDNQIKIMKLSSGEEIVSEMIGEDHPRAFNIKSPLKLTSLPRLGNSGIEESISLQRWIHFAEEKDVTIPKSQVIAIINASYGLKKFYEYCILKMERQDSGEDTSYDAGEYDEFEEEEDLDEFLDEWEPDTKLIH